VYQFDLTISSAVAADTAPPAPSREPITGPLSDDLLGRMQRYWQAANYLTIGQIYLQANPLLGEPLRPEHIKPRLLGHWGTSPGLNMLCVHLNRVIKRDDLNVIYVIGPGHGGPGLGALRGAGWLAAAATGSPAARPVAARLTELSLRPPPREGARERWLSELRRSGPEALHALLRQEGNRVRGRNAQL